MKHFDQRVCLSVCLLAYLRKLYVRISQTYCTCYLWPLHGPPVRTVHYVMYLQFADIIMFSHNGDSGPESSTTLLHQVCQVAAPAGTWQT